MPEELYGEFFYVLFSVVFCFKASASLVVKENAAPLFC